MPTLAELPNDVHLAILFSVDEFTSLYNFIRACRIINDAFKNTKVLVLKSVMHRAIDRKLLGYALAMQDVRRLRSRDELAIANFMDRWLVDRPLQYPIPGTELYRTVASHHRLIEVFTPDVLLTLAPKVGEVSTDPVPTNLCRRFCEIPLTSEETTRIVRALYRYQLYCRLFTPGFYLDVDYDDDLDVSVPHFWFLYKLPLWEVEELSCAYNFLHKRLSVALTELLDQRSGRRIDEKRPSDSLGSGRSECKSCHLWK